MKVLVCIGSSCHKKGSYRVQERLKELVEENGLSNEVTFGSAFCLGHCRDGITISIDEEIITGVGMGNVDDVFQQFILNRED